MTEELTKEELQDRAEWLARKYYVKYQNSPATAQHLSDVLEEDFSEDEIWEIVDKAVSQVKENQSQIAHQ